MTQQTKPDFQWRYLCKDRYSATFVFKGRRYAAICEDNSRARFNVFPYDFYRGISDDPLLSVIALDEKTITKAMEDWING